MQPGTETPHRNARRGRLPARATRDNPGSLPEGKSTLITTDTQTELLREEIRAVADLLFRITDDVDTAVAKIMRLYRRYHSSRWIGDRMVLRLQSPLPPGVVEQLTAEFADVLAEPWIEACQALPEEADEPGLAALPRLLLPLRRRGAGRLRRLIDRVNAV